MENRVYYVATVIKHTIGPPRQVEAPRSLKQGVDLEPAIVRNSKIELGWLKTRFYDAHRKHYRAISDMEYRQYRNHGIDVLSKFVESQKTKILA